MRLFLAMIGYQFPTQPIFVGHGALLARLGRTGTPLVKRLNTSGYAVHRAFPLEKQNPFSTV